MEKTEDKSRTEISTFVKVSGILILVCMVASLLFPSIFILGFLISFILLLLNIRQLLVASGEKELRWGKSWESDQREEEERDLIVDLTAKDLEKEKQQ
ncbi:MAG: hypothetical protein GWO20_10365 [Candidatus Korarchaeota archaeon]|nr:hypothetical protein [Candidatus Korarchaeota archaeon]NIU83898.1 hypothetical protein [Candidatus Thorarchaeota archaeon]NIW14041.1 hypothetical protein [Candidatus Thorarchaeota archaeon]NIW51730.1 hypothetical protein [Candidatus Korarchaeota archaeon]